jgi:hypothetical protein
MSEHTPEVADAAIDAFVALVQEYHDVLKATGRDGDPVSLFAADARVREAAIEYQEIVFDLFGWSSPLAGIESPDDGEDDPLLGAESVVAGEVAAGT